MNTPLDGSASSTPAPPVPSSAPAEAGLWLSISEIAAQRSVSKQAISSRVAALGLETRPGPRGAKLVNLAAFVTAIGETGDPAKELAAATKAARDEPAAGTGPGDLGGAPARYRDEAGRKAGFEADLKEIELRERLGELVPVTEVTAAMVKCAEALVRVLDRLPARAGEMVAAVEKDREAGARGALKGIARDLRTALENEMKLLAAPPAPEGD